MNLITTSKTDNLCGYCQYLGINGSGVREYDAKIYMHNLLHMVMEWNTDLEKMYFDFIEEWWIIYHHELIHGIGYKERLPMYSTRKTDHFRWITEQIIKALVDIWAEDNRIKDITRMFDALYVGKLP